VRLLVFPLYHPHFLIFELVFYHCVVTLVLTGFTMKAQTSFYIHTLHSLSHPWLTLEYHLLNLVITEGATDSSVSVSPSRAQGCKTICFLDASYKIRTGCLELTRTAPLTLDLFGNSYLPFFPHVGRGTLVVLLFPSLLLAGLNK